MKYYIGKYNCEKHDEKHGQMATQTSEAVNSQRDLSNV